MFFAILDKKLRKKFGGFKESLYLRNYISCMIEIDFGLLFFR